MYNRNENWDDDDQMASVLSRKYTLELKFN